MLTGHYWPGYLFIFHVPSVNDHIGHTPTVKALKHVWCGRNVYIYFYLSIYLYYSTLQDLSHGRTEKDLSNKALYFRQ